MNATTNLENDHIHILRLTDVMEEVIKRPVADTGDLEKITYLIRNYADGLHHRKEELLLFPKMAEKGFSFHQGPVAVMMNEHSEGRNFVKAMAENISLLKEGNKEAQAVVYANMRGYIELLRAHIAKENNVLFRMADNVLSEAEQKALLSEFITVDGTPVCGGTVSDCIRQIDSLAKTYGTNS